MRAIPACLREVKMRSSALVLVTASALVAIAPTAAAAGVTRTPSSLTVETQFWDAASEATGTGLLSGCTAVTGLGQVSTRSAHFIGRKSVDCGDGGFVLGFQASFEGVGTTGTWRVLSSTGSLTGLSGSGALVGGPDCVVAAGSQGCIEDTFTGTLFLAPG